MPAEQAPFSSDGSDHWDNLSEELHFTFHIYDIPSDSDDIYSSDEDLYVEDEDDDDDPYLVSVIPTSIQAGNNNSEADPIDTASFRAFLFAVDLDLSFASLDDHDGRLGAAERASFDEALEKASQHAASKESIENLEVVNVVELGLLQDTVCAICLEEFRIGSDEAKRMPCSHIYHGNCIVRWLQICNTCPLCRHRMPPAASD